MTIDAPAPSTRVAAGTVDTPASTQIGMPNAATRSTRLTSDDPDAALYRVEVCEVELPNTEHVDVHARERDRVPVDPLASRDAYRRVCVSTPAEGVNRAAVTNVDHPDYAHVRNLSLQLGQTSKCNWVRFEFQRESDCGTERPKFESDPNFHLVSDPNIIPPMNHRGVAGWDIGGVNTKVARVRDGVVLTARSQPFELQRDPDALAPLLRSLAESVGASADDRHAVTMTAELSQMFRTKREGVAFVLDAVTAAFPSSDVSVYAVDGRFLSPSDARREPLAIAASNWAATASVVASDHPDAILIDIGTTTTDIVPIAGGSVAARGTTDPARLASGELVYTGALRTPVEAIVQRVPLGASFAAVSAESFALIGDVHVWRGDLAAEDYSVTAPDRRPASREFAGERIARVVCADREMLDDRAISERRRRYRRRTGGPDLPSDRRGTTSAPVASESGRHRARCVHRRTRRATGRAGSRAARGRDWYRRVAMRSRRRGRAAARASSAVIARCFTPDVPAA